MFTGNAFGLAAFAAAIAASFLSSSPAVSGDSPQPKEGNTRYLPIQSISYELGSKVASGYFVQRGAVCAVTLMIAEKSDPDESSPPTAARVRLMLDPGEVAGLDSEEGRSLNFTCGEDAATLLVDYGERSELVARQSFAVSSRLADRAQDRR